MDCNDSRETSRNELRVQQETAHERVQTASTDSEHSDKLIAAITKEVYRAYEDYVTANGSPDSHEKGTEILFGLAAAVINREMKRRDGIKKQRAEKDAASTCVLQGAELVLDLSSNEGN